MAKENTWEPRENLENIQELVDSLKKNTKKRPEK